jgi:hypothetical protein
LKFSLIPRLNILAWKLKDHLSRNTTGINPCNMCHYKTPGLVPGFFM